MSPSLFQGKLSPFWPTIVLKRRLTLLAQEPCVWEGRGGDRVPPLPPCSALSPGTTPHIARDTCPSHPSPRCGLLCTLKENCLFCPQSSTEHKDLPESGEEPRGEAEAPCPDAGHPESAGEHALDPSAPASASASSPPPPAPAAQPHCVRELAGVSAHSPPCTAVPGPSPSLFSPKTT